MQHTHLTRMILEQTKKYGKRPALYYKEDGQWKYFSWQETGRQIEGIARALLNAGFGEEERVGIFSHNMPQWTIADYGIMGIRAITTTIYATSSIVDLEYIVNDAEIRLLFVGGHEQYERAMEIFGKNKFLQKIVVFDKSTPIEKSENVLYFDEFVEQGLAADNKDVFDKRLSEASEEDIATIIYTSGTTGLPKGVMLTHKNIMSQFKALDPLFNISENDIELCFLPFSHSYQKSSTHWTQSHGVTVYYCENPKEILDYFKEVRPTFMVGVPRLYEKMYAKVYATIEESSALKRSLFNWAVKIGKEYQYKVFRKEKISASLRTKHNLARKLVLNKIREIMGGRLNFFSAGGAPLASKIEEFFFAAGIFIAQGYGLTETSPVVSCNRPDQFKFGTPGKVVDICQVKIAPDGEIMVKGENVMKGYFRKPDLTAEVMTEDGWFKTGDIGHLDDEGFLHITDRKKDLIITAGGKNIAPQRIESLIGADYYIEQIAVIGDKRKYLTALIVPSFEALEELAKDRGIRYHSINDLVKNEKIIEFYRERIDALSKPLASYEKIKKFRLLPVAFTLEKDEITPTLKLKRKIIEAHYQDLIEKMYDE
ncbi:long-chain fatty acid--CoA ligase [candidate division KSB1 bacterium]|nr:MAG: long-chain fatty acid--CoA ligase [candidate division KSB1 bacterium]